MRAIVAVLLFFISLAGCGIYSFSNTSLPSHLKTLNIPLFANQSLEPNIADEITQELNKEILSKNLLKIISDRGDATIDGKVTAYESVPYTFGSTGNRQVDVDQYIVRITADVEFLDNVKNQPLFKGQITGEGIFNFKTETEQAGREKAMKDLVQRLMENSVQSW